MGTDDVRRPAESLLANLPPFITVNQAAQALQVSPDTIYRAVAAQDLRACRIGRCVRIAPEDLAYYVSLRSTAAAADVPAERVQQLARALRELDPAVMRSRTDAAVAEASGGWGRRGKGQRKC